MEIFFSTINISWKNYLTWFWHYAIFFCALQQPHTHRIVLKSLLSISEQCQEHTQLLLGAGDDWRSAHASFCPKKKEERALENVLTTGNRSRTVLTYQTVSIFVAFFTAIFLLSLEALCTIHYRIFLKSVVYLLFWSVWLAVVQQLL